MATEVIKITDAAIPTTTTPLDADLQWTTQGGVTKKIARGDLVKAIKAINRLQGATIASATTTDIGAATGNYIDISGTTTIEGLGTVQAGSERTTTFTGILTLTHNATKLILPTGADIITAVNDVAVWVSLASGNWKCVSYTRADGTPLAGSADADLDSIQFDIAAGVSVGQGEMAWNSDEETLDLGLNGAVLQLGQETHWHVRNNSGSDIADGKAVMATGTIGASGRITIDLMDGSDIANAKLFLGLTTEAIPNGTDGKVTSLGKVRDIDTTAWNEGDILWVDNSTSGELTSTMPTTKVRLPIAFVITDHAVNGVLAVRATDGTFLQEAHDTSIVSPATDEILVYDGTQWVNTKPKVEIGLAISDETTDLTTGTAKITFRMPYAMTLTGVRANVNTAPTGSVLTVDINETASSILSTKITIDATEKTSETAATPPVISDSALADDAEITIDIDTIGSTIAGKGLKIWLIGTRN